MEKLKDCSHTVIPSDCLFMCCPLRLLCLAVLQPLPMASPGPALPRSWSIRWGTQRLQACLCSFQLSFPPPEFITHFIRAGTRSAVGMYSWGWPSGIWLLFLAAAWVCVHQSGCITSPWFISALTSHLGCLVMVYLHFKTYSPSAFISLYSL